MSNLKIDNIIATTATAAIIDNIQ